MSPTRNFCGLTLRLGVPGKAPPPHRRPQRRLRHLRQQLAQRDIERWVVCHDRSLTIYHACFHIACFIIVLRTILKWLLKHFSHGGNCVLIKLRATF